MKKFIENKSIGYWIAAADAVLALFLGIFYMATFKEAIGSNASGNVPETVGIFMLAGFAIECVLLVLPQYSFINIFAIAMYGISLFKEVYLIPDFIAGEINNVRYNGGDFGLNLTYFIFQFVIIISAIVATFLGFYKNEDEAKEDFKIKKTPLCLGKICGGAAVIIAAALAAPLSSVAVEKKAAEEAAEAARLAEEARIKNMFNPITEEVKAKAEACEYSYDPSDLIVKEEETWDYSIVEGKNIPLKFNYGDEKKRTDDPDVYLVYYFEGAYSEGWQGDYSPTYCYLYLWSDGIFGGMSGKEDVVGYWFNSSLESGYDTKEKKDVADCLRMVTNSSNENFRSINANMVEGFYQYDLWMFLDMGKVWNQGSNGRTIHMFGFRYYPEIAIDIDMGVLNDHVYRVGDNFLKSNITLIRILQNLNYGSVFSGSTNNIEMIDEDGVYDATEHKFVKAGELTFKGTYKGLNGENFECTKTITIVGAK